MAIVALLGTVPQTAGAWGEDLRGRLDGGAYTPPGPSGPSTPPTTESLTVTITYPAAAAIDTTDASMVIRGSASSGAGIAAVSWKSSRGQSGSATGTANWATGLIPLQLGTNTITVTAYDRAGKAASDVIVINRESMTPRPVTLSWVAPTQRVDGTPLTDLAGYKIHYGRLPGTYDYQLRIDNPGLLSYVVSNLSPGTWYFSMTAFDRTGSESAYSNEVLKRVQ